MNSQRSKLKRLQRIVDALRHFIETDEGWDIVEQALATDVRANLTKRELQRLRKEVRVTRLSKSAAQKLLLQREEAVSAEGPGSLTALRAMRKKKALRRRGIW